VFFWDALTPGPVFEAPGLTVSAFKNAANKLVCKVKIRIFHHQNQELTALRDWLLPMLMNGQVTVGCSESAGSREKGGAK
jgi:type I restriction enzyme S subunit